MQKSDIFFRNAITEIFEKSQVVIDVGGALRVDETKNNRESENAWAIPLLKKSEYKVLDKVPDYNPDIVGDIHDLPFEDNSIDAIICISVLEHVEEPMRAVREMYRVLKPGGYCYIYAPFLFYYHPMKGYYKDFYRFTRDGMEYMTKDFSDVKIHGTYGAIATVMNLFPFFSRKVGFFHHLDKFFGKDTSDQTSGYHAFCVK